MRKKKKIDSTIGETGPGEYSENYVESEAGIVAVEYYIMQCHCRRKLKIDYWISRVVTRWFTF